MVAQPTSRLLPQVGSWRQSAYPLREMRWYDAIRDFVRSKHCLQIGEYTAEGIKKDLGALVSKDEFDEVEYEIGGTPA